MENKDVESCLPCKVVSVCCCCGIGGYLLNVSRTSVKNSKLTLILMGASSIGLGIGEIFDVSPFRTYVK